MNARLFALLFLFALANDVQALNVFACEPEWAALTRELAGDKATIYTATTAQQDPHFIQARPSLIAEIRKAELLVCSGAELEVGWLPLLLRRSSNRAIDVGQPGHFLAAEQVRRLEVPTVIDRSQGDVHPQGNPHVHLDPNNLRRIARALGARLQQMDPANASHYEVRLDDFLTRWRSASERWEAAGAELAGTRVITHHRSFSYLANWLDLDVVANIEPKPGIPVSSAHLADLLQRFTDAPPELIIRTPYADERPSQWLEDRLKAPAIELPYTISDEVPDLFALFEQTLTALRGAGS